MPEFLQRPIRIRGEWWDGYVARVLIANGFVPRDRYMLNKLSPLVEQVASSGVKQISQAGSNVEGALRVFASHRLPDWAVRGDKASCAHCPHCLHDSHHVRLVWRLTTETSCAAHGVPLTSKCGACLRSVFHWDLTRRVCVCGVAFARPAAGKLTDEGEGCGDLDRQAGDWELDPEQLAMTVFLGRLLPLLAAASFSRGRERPPTSSDFMARLGLTVRPRVDWASELWNALPSATHLRRALHLVLRLRAEDKTAPSLLGTLPLWSWAQSLSDLGASSVAAERKGWVGVGELSRGLVSATEAVRLAGLGGRRFQELLASGEVTPIRTLSAGVRQHQFSADQVCKLMQLKRPGCRHGTPMDLGVEGNGVRVLKKAGIVNSVMGPGGNDWLDYDELRSLLDALGKRASAVAGVSGPKVSLGSKRVWQSIYIPSLRALFDRLLSGEFELWSCGESPGFARFYIGPDAISFLHRSSMGWGPELVDGMRTAELPLHGGEMAWQPSRQAWHRRPLRGWFQGARQHAVQLPLPMFPEAA